MTFHCNGHKIFLVRCLNIHILSEFARILHSHLDLHLSALAGLQLKDISVDCSTVTLGNERQGNRLFLIVTERKLRLDRVPHSSLANVNDLTTHRKRCVRVIAAGQERG